MRKQAGAELRQAQSQLHVLGYAAWIQKKFGLKINIKQTKQKWSKRIVVLDNYDKTNIDIEKIFIEKTLLETKIKLKYTFQKPHNCPF